MSKQAFVLILGLSLSGVKTTAAEPKTLGISFPAAHVRMERISYKLDSPLFSGDASLQFDQSADSYVISTIAHVKTFFKDITRTMTCNWFFNGNFPQDCMERGKSEKKRWLYFFSPSSLQVKEMDQENVKKEQAFRVQADGQPIMELLAVMYALRGKQGELDKTPLQFKAFLDGAPEQMVTEYLGTRGYRSPINSGETPHQVVKLRSPQKDSNLNKYDLQAWEDTASGELTQFTFKVFGSGATATIDKVERE